MKRRGAYELVSSNVTFSFLFVFIVSCRNKHRQGLVFSSLHCTASLPFPSPHFLFALAFTFDRSFKLSTDSSVLG